MRELTDKYNLSDKVHFIGWRSDIPDILQTIDIYVSTSYNEGMPDAVREAMAVGKPVVVTDVGGTFELVKHGKSGFLFSPGDIDSLVKYLKKLINNPQLRVFMGREGKRIIEQKFSTEEYARNFEKMIFDIISQKDKIYKNKSI